MFELVADIERYPDFVPGWRFVEVRRRTERTMEVHQVVQMAGVRLAFESLATLEPPRRITIAADTGVFEAFGIEWHFGACSGGCNVTLETRVAMRNGVLQAVLAPVLARQHRAIIRCFELEAERRHGGA